MFLWNALPYKNQLIVHDRDVHTNSSVNFLQEIATQTWHRG